MRYVLTLAVAAAGCGNEQRRTHADDPLRFSAERKAARKAAKEAEAEEIKKDRPALVKMAVESVRHSAAEWFGSNRSAAAKITADESGIRMIGAHEWEVTGFYDGPDFTGIEFTAQFVVRIRPEPDGKLKAVLADLKDRTYKGGKKAPAPDGEQK
jgi:hypothetical protein